MSSKLEGNFRRQFKDCRNLRRELECDLRRKLKVCRKNLRRELEGALRHVLSFEDKLRRERVVKRFEGKLKFE